MSGKRFALLLPLLLLLAGCGGQAYSDGASPFGPANDRDAVFGESKGQNDNGAVFGQSSPETTAEKAATTAAAPAEPVKTTTAATTRRNNDTVSHPSSPTNAKACTTHRDMLSESDKECYDKLLSSFSSGSLSSVLRPGITGADITLLHDSVQSDHPEFFWITGRCSYITATGSVSFAALSTVNENNHTEYEQRLKQGVQDIVSQVPEDIPLYDKILLVHDIIVNNTVYGTDYGTAAREDTERYYTAYGCIVEHRAVCEGYAKGFMAVMNELGVPCGVVSGKDKRTGEGHAWNYVQYEGNYYWIDVTWDDPLTVTDDDSDGEDGTLSHEYFFIDDEELNKTHTISRGESVFVPECTSSEHTYYKETGQYMADYSLDEVDQLLSRYNGKIKIKFADKDVYNTAFEELIRKNSILQTSYAKSIGANYCQKISFEEQLTLEFVF